VSEGTPQSAPGHSEAERLFDEHLARLERGEEADFEALCAAHPEQAGALRRLEGRGSALHETDEGPVSLFRGRGERAAVVPGPWDVAEGRVLGDYRLVGRIGRGGMGEVWEAEQVSLSRRVALKLLLPERVDTRGVDFFAREARAGGKLAHPGIVAVHGMGETDGLHWIAMELVEENCDLRRSLDGLREEGELGAGYYRHVAEFIAALADALEAAHAAGVIHRDLKPANVLVTRDDRPKLTDFGLAKLTDERSLSVVGDVAGTYYYMSPEQVASKRAGLDHRTDVFSLGVVLYEMLTLIKPFEGDTSEQVAQKILWEDPPDPRTIHSRAPRDLAVICARAMEKEPARRYQSMGELVADVRRHLANEPILARPSGALARTAKWARRNPTKSVAGGIAALAMVAISAVGLIAVEKAREAEDQKSIAQANAALARQRADELVASNELLAEQTEAARRNAQEAETQKRMAQENADQAAKRADELQQVSAFQAEQLSGVDAAAMGLTIHSMVLERARAAGERAGREPTVLEEEQAELEKLLAGANFTDLALAVLDKEVFEGALKALEDFEEQPLVQAQLLQTVATTLQELGLLERALEPQERALKIRRRELGNERSDTLASINNLGLLFYVQGKLDEAEPLLREALEGSRRTLGDEHPNTLARISNLATLSIEQGKHDEAEPLIREALEGYRRTLGDEHAETLISISILGSLLSSQGKMDEAEPLVREALKGQRRTLGDEHSDTLGSINLLGKMLGTRDRLSEAEPLLREVLDVHRRKLGDEHPDTLTSITNLGFLLCTQGRFDEAEPLLREALEGCRRTLGDEHPSTLGSINNLGGLFRDRGKPAEAEPLMREALNVSRRKLGDEHPITLASINNLAHVLLDQGKLAEAEPLLREALEGCRRQFGDEHSNTLALINTLGTLLHDQGNLVEAEPLVREALEGCRRTFGDEHPNTLKVKQNLEALINERKEAKTPPTEEDDG
jgi:non-specific serine/threonine protein kinase/serine/threonine-protein kinase